MNDLLKKNNKHVLILGANELFLKYLESIMYFSSLENEEFED